MACQYLDVEAEVDLSEGKYEDDDEEDNCHSSLFVILWSTASDLCFNDLVYFIDDADIDAQDQHATQNALT